MGDTASQKSADTSDAEDEITVAPRASNVLSQSAQENVQLETSDEADLGQFGEIMDLGDTPLDDLRTMERCDAQR